MQVELGPGCILRKPFINTRRVSDDGSLVCKVT